MTADENTPVKPCRLCGINPPIENSHILPRFVGKKAKKATGSQRLLTLTGKEKFQQDTLKLPFLCKQCEQRFGVLETQFANQWFHCYPNHPPSEEIKEKVIRFYNSVAWRCLRFLMEKNAIPTISAQDAEDTERFLRHHLHNETPAPPWNGYLFYASDFENVPGAPPQELMRYAGGFAMVLFVNRTFLFEEPNRPAIISVIGPFIYVFELQPSEAIENSDPEQWEGYRIGAGLVRSPKGPPPQQLTKWLTRILCSPRDEYSDDEFPAFRLVDEEDDEED